MERSVCGWGLLEPGLEPVLTPEPQCRTPTTPQGSTLGRMCTSPDSFLTLHTKHTVVPPKRCFPSSLPLPGSPASQSLVLWGSPWPHLGGMDWQGPATWPPCLLLWPGGISTSGLGLQVQGHFLSPHHHIPPSKWHSHDPGRGPPPPELSDRL